MRCESRSVMRLGCVPCSPCGNRPRPRHVYTHREHSFQHRPRNDTVDDDMLENTAQGCSVFSRGGADKALGPGSHLGRPAAWSRMCWWLHHDAAHPKAGLPHTR